MMFYSDKLHDSWLPFFTDDIINRINHIESVIGDDFNPAPNQVLRFATTDFSKIKVIVLGQDPYPQKGVPTGRSFEVSNLLSWCDKFKQTSSTFRKLPFVLPTTLTFVALAGTIAVRL